MTKPIMARATAVWLVDNTTLTFKQIADFTGMHELEVQGIADGDVATGVKGFDPVANNQLTQEDIEKGQKDPMHKLKLKFNPAAVGEETRRGPRYTPLSKRQDRPAAIYWLVKFHPELTDGQIGKLVGTTIIPDENRTYMRESSELTKHNTRMHMVFVFNYGSRWELTEAARSIARAAAAGELDPEAIDQATFAGHFSVPDMPDLDLVIRSSGEHRLSNYLLWQAAYAEFSFPGILWPDFDREALLDSVVEYQQRDRRFGGAIDKTKG
jgi:hypothetical protein